MAAARAAAAPAGPAPAQAWKDLLGPHASALSGTELRLVGSFTVVPLAALPGVSVNSPTTRHSFFKDNPRAAVRAIAELLKADVLGLTHIDLGCTFSSAADCAASLLILPLSLRQLSRRCCARTSHRRCCTAHETDVALAPRFVAPVTVYSFPFSHFQFT